jgi:hypothetical protein
MGNTSNVENSTLMRFGSVPKKREVHGVVKNITKNLLDMKINIRHEPEKLEFFN